MKAVQEMGNSLLEKINRINFNPQKESGNIPSVLWITATTSENRNDLTFRNHRHAFYEIHIIEYGEIVYGIGDKEVTVREGNSFIIEPGVTHRVIRHSSEFFKISLAVALTDNYELLGGESAKERLLITTPKGITDSIAFIAESNKSFGLYAEDIIKSRLREIVYIIADAISGRNSPPQKEYDGRIFRAKKYIEDNPSSFFTCSEIAEFCRLSEKQMHRLFYKYEGKSLLAYIHEQKITAAKKKLKGTEETQESIALSLGFSSVHYFNKFFIRHTAVSPGEYRKDNRK